MQPWSDVELNFIKDCFEKGMCEFDTYAAHSKRFKIDRSERAIKTMAYRKGYIGRCSTRNPTRHKQSGKDEKLKSLKYKSSRRVYAKQVFYEKIISSYKFAHDVNERLKSRKYGDAVIRKKIYSEMVAMGFYISEIAIASGKDRTSISSALRK